MSSVLVCGVNGFVGKHLARAFVQAGYQVDGVVQNEPLTSDLEGVVHRAFKCDLTNKNEVETLDLSPYVAIVNLAGLANVGASFKQPDVYMRTNVDVLRFIGEKALAHKLPLRLVAISTGAIYDSGQPMPLTENSKTASDTSPYAKSKLAMEQAAETLRQAGLDCVIVRPFNHIGPGQGPGFVLPDLYEGLVHARITNAPLLVGNLKTRRDYTDVRDIVRAYVLLATAPKDLLHYHLYNVCSGVSRSGEEILHGLQSTVPNTGHIQVVVDKARMRPNDPPELKGSYGRLKADVGWTPFVSFSQTIQDFVDFKTKIIRA